MNAASLLRLHDVGMKLGTYAYAEQSRDWIMLYAAETPFYMRKRLMVLVEIHDRDLREMRCWIMIVARTGFHYDAARMPEVEQGGDLVRTGLVNCLYAPTSLSRTINRAS